MSGECDKCGEHALECRCIDKKSTIYFMTQMTQKEFEELNKFRPSYGNKDYETGWSKDERYLLNKIRSKHIEKLENENEMDQRKR